MFARISTYDLAPGESERAVTAFSTAIDRIRELDGLQEAFFLLERDGERAVTITLWDSDAAMEASRVAASSARTEAAREIDAVVTSSYEYAVVLHERGSATAPHA